jgi:pre-60S factor REI1
MYDVDSEPMPTSRVAPLPAACDEVAPPTRCLFCNVNSQTLDANMEHMASSHGLSIPSTDQISDIESFLSYLAVIVYKYNECLYCGVEKGSVDAVQTHMRDKGHCKIDPAELTDFLDTEEEKTEVEEGATVKLSQTEMRLPSGLHITSSRHTDTTLHRPLRRSTNSRLRNRIDRSTSPSSALTTYQTSAPTSLVLTPHTKTDPHSRQLATRHTMGLAGISTQTLRTLQLVDKKAKTVESVAKARVRHKAEQQPVKTMYYKTENPVYQAG